MGDCVSAPFGFEVEGTSSVRTLFSKMMFQVPSPGLGLAPPGCDSASSPLPLALAPAAGTGIGRALAVTPSPQQAEVLADLHDSPVRLMFRFHPHPSNLHHPRRHDCDDDALLTLGCA